MVDLSFLNVKTSSCIVNWVELWSGANAWPGGFGPRFVFLVSGHGGDCLLLLLRLDGTGSLSDFAGADRLILEECVVPVSDHGAVAEELKI